MNRRRHWDCHRLRRFAGPPGSANGGDACVLTAPALTDGPAEEPLRRPPPVDRAAAGAQANGRSAPYDGDQPVAEARAHARWT